MFDVARAPVGAPNAGFFSRLPVLIDAHCRKEADDPSESAVETIFLQLSIFAARRAILEGLFPLLLGRAERCSRSRTNTE